MRQKGLLKTKIFRLRGSQFFKHTGNYRGLNTTARDTKSPRAVIVKWTQNGHREKLKSPQASAYRDFNGGDDGARTRDLLRDRQAL